MNKTKFSMFFIILSGTCLFWGCTGLTLFNGNTKRDYRDFGLEERAYYRKTRSLDKITQSEKEAEILSRLQEDDARKGKVKKLKKTKELFH